MRRRRAMRIFAPACCILLIAAALAFLLAGCRASATTADRTTTASSTSAASKPTSVNTSAKPTGAPDAQTTASQATTENASASATKPPNSYLFPQLNEAFRSTFPDSFPPRDDLRLRTDKATYPIGTDKITFTIENHTDQEMTSGEPYALEVRTGNAWYSMPYRKLPPNVYRAWLAYASIIPANGSWSHVIHLSEHVGWEPGRYRLVKMVYNGIYISTEFTIE